MSCANSAAMDESSSSDFWQLRSQETAATSRETWRLIHQLLITQQSMGLWRDKEEDHHQKTGSKTNTQQLEEFMELARNGMSEGPTPLMPDLSLSPSEPTRESVLDFEPGESSSIQPFENPNKSDSPVQLNQDSTVIDEAIEDRTLLIKIHLQLYSISCEVLDQVFARFGVIEYMEVFAAGEKYHSRIRFQNKESAIRAIDSMNHRDVYDGCCRLELSLVAQTSSQSSEIEFPNQETDEDLKEFQGQVEQFNNSGAEELPNQQISTSFIASTHMVVDESESATIGLKESKDNSINDNGESNSEFPNPSLALISDTFDSSISASNVSGQVENGMVVERIDLTEDELMIDSFLDNSSALQVFVEMPRRGIELLTALGGELAEVEVLIETRMINCWNAYNLFDEMPKRGINVIGYNSWIFDPGIWESCTELSGAPKSEVHWILIFDPGGFWLLLRRKNGMFYAEFEVVLIWLCAELKKESVNLDASRICFQFHHKGIQSPMFIFALGSNEKDVTIRGDCDGFLIVPHTLEGFLESSASVDHTDEGCYYCISVSATENIATAQLWRQQECFFPFVSISDVCIEVDDKRLQWDPGILNLRFRKRRLSCKGSSGVLCSKPFCQKKILIVSLVWK